MGKCYALSRCPAANKGSCVYQQKQVTYGITPRYATQKHCITSTVYMCVSSTNPLPCTEQLSKSSPAVHIQLCLRRELKQKFISVKSGLTAFYFNMGVTLIGNILFQSIACNHHCGKLYSDMESVTVIYRVNLLKGEERGTRLNGKCNSHGNRSALQLDRGV